MSSMILQKSGCIDSYRRGEEMLLSNENKAVVIISLHFA